MATKITKVRPAPRAWYVRVTTRSQIGGEAVFESQPYKAEGDAMSACDKLKARGEKAEVLCRERPLRTAAPKSEQQALFAVEQKSHDDTTKKARRPRKKKAAPEMTNVTETGVTVVEEPFLAEEPSE